MNIKHLETFWAVMSTGTIKDAARLLHVSVPAVSKIISHLELSVGFPLFDRNKGRLYPTEDAKRIFESVEDIHKQLRTVELLTQELAQKRRGLLRIVSSPSIGHELVPLAIARLLKKKPKLHIRFSCLIHDFMKEFMLSGHADIAISTLPMDHPNLSTRLIARNQLVCICPWDHPLALNETVTVKDLENHNLIGYLHETPMASRIDELFKSFGITPTTQIKVGSPHNSCSLVQAGAGIALVEQVSLQSWPKSSFWTLLIEGAKPILADIVFPRGAPLSHEAQLFAESLGAILQERGLSTDGTSAVISPRISLSQTNH